MKYLSVSKYIPDIPNISKYIPKVIPRHIAVSIVLAVFVAVLGGRLVWSSWVGSTPAFSIQLPDEVHSTTYSLEDGQEMVVYENADATIGFQVFTMPVTGPLPTTVEELWNEMPDLTVTDLETSVIDGRDAITFYSQDPDIGETFEVWFVHDGLLYQVMTYRHLETWLTDILQTWQFRSVASPNPVSLLLPHR